MAIPTEKLLQFIEAGKTCNEICFAFSITPQQLFQKLTDLQNENLFFEHQYYSNGSILYKPVDKEVVEAGKEKNYKKSDNHILITEKGSKDLKCLVFSDLHVGNSKQRLDLLDAIYNYNIKNGIHITFCCGDMIDGISSSFKQETKDVYKQTETFLRHYPYDSSILTFAVAGNHEYRVLKEENIDFVDIIQNCRHDIVLSSYGNARIFIKNEKIMLFHRLSRSNPSYHCSIMLLGHSHKYIINSEHKHLNVYVPSLSCINKSIPTALEITFRFEYGNIVSTTIKHLLFGEYNCILSEIEYDAFKKKPRYPSIKYEEEFRPEVLETIEECEKKLVLKPIEMNKR